MDRPHLKNDGLMTDFSQAANEPQLHRAREGVNTPTLSIFGIELKLPFESITSVIDNCPVGPPPRQQSWRRQWTARLRTPMINSLLWLSEQAANRMRNHSPKGNHNNHCSNFVLPCCLFDARGQNLCPEDGLTKVSRKHTGDADGKL